MSEFDELEKILANMPAEEKDRIRGVSPKQAIAVEEYQPPEGSLVQWSTADGKTYFPATKTVKALPPGVYDIGESTRGLYFEAVPVKTEGLIRFPQTNSNKVLAEIQTFWTQEQRFRDYNLSYKRGIILWGPPGSGKSSTVQLIMRDVIERNGIVIKFTHPSLFVAGLRSFRQVQRDTPVVVIMEDIDSILETYCESNVLNILDGCEQIDKIVFLATTNYPERLGARIINRPSRFDKRFKIGHPNTESRRLYFESLMKGNMAQLGVDIESWVRDTKGFSLAHLKELFVAVCILGDDYKTTVRTLESMKEKVTSDDDIGSTVGFNTRRDYDE